jgi:hypothetical protein
VAKAQAKIDSLAKIEEARKNAKADAEKKVAEA